MYQKFLAVGNLGQDPVMRQTPSGANVTNLSLAVNDKWRDRDGQDQERTVWFSVACWGRLAETTAQWLQKGSQVLVEGEIRGARPYEGRDGEMKASIDVNAFKVQFIRGIKGRDETREPVAVSAGGGDTSTYDGLDELSSDEIPF
jgi:single-strand DNA-binding protein